MNTQANIEQTERAMMRGGATAREPASPYAERQMLAMSWAAISLGFFVVLAGIALGAAAVFNSGFLGWLITVGVMGVVIALIVAVVVYALRLGR